ncbi:hypothetical protein PSACC_02022 [Paramicrosporidium saccamoebae]|uniref:Mitochondrial import inner membrane translocase subunit TIM50 n=1 Tax=Paramicrosporidium saccamoebae TaxID=1246581 RepID=A0A2H9TKB5_9FUNG|nr:hypothetical protein PSACC_02022 [Paramicrosporidium saccamoebae]
MNAPRRLLFILDLNGTLLHRLTKSWEVRLAHEHCDYRDADCTVNGNQIFFRPERRQFLAKLFELGEVAVWTSALPKNAVPMVLRTFGGLLDAGKLRMLSPSIEAAMKNHLATAQEVGTGPNILQFLWTQEECQVIRSTDDVKPKFKKDLEKVWKAFPAYSEETTIMIDDSADKLSAHMDNLLQLPEYVVTDPNVDFANDKVLVELTSFVQKLTAHGADVRDYIKMNPYMQRTRQQ